MQECNVLSQIAKLSPDQLELFRMLALFEASPKAKEIVRPERPRIEGRDARDIGGPGGYRSSWRTR